MKIFLTFLFALLASISFGGHYDVTLTGGKIDAPQGPYPFQRDDYGGYTAAMVADAEFSMAPGYDSVAGELKSIQTATFTWVPDNTQDQPPEAVVIYEGVLLGASRYISFVGWESSMNVTGSIGMDSESRAIGSASGTKWSLIQNPGSTFTVTWAPSVQVSPLFPED